MKFNEYDSVTLLRDDGQNELKKGDIGAVVMVFTEPNEAYEVEFVDDNGDTKAIITVLPNEIEAI